MDQGVVPSGLSGDDPILDLLVIAALFLIAAIFRLYLAFKARPKKMKSPIQISRPVQLIGERSVDEADKVDPLDCPAFTKKTKLPLS